MSEWFVYIVRCSDQSLYTGITTDLTRRLDEHNHKINGAKYTRLRRPVSLVWSQTCTDRSDASKKEYSIKKLRKSKKEQMIVLQKDFGF
jgi:putative endonuclease